MDTISERTRRWLRLLIAFLMALLLVEVLMTPAQGAGSRTFLAQSQITAALSGVWTVDAGPPK